MKENNQNQEVVAPLEGQQQQPQQQPQVEPVKTRSAKLLETAERLREAAHIVAAADAPASAEQPEKPAAIPRELPGVPSDSTGEGDNHQPEEKERERNLSVFERTAEGFRSLFEKTLIQQNQAAERMVRVREEQAAKTIELLEASNQIHSDIVGQLEHLVQILKTILQSDIWGTEAKK